MAKTDANDVFERTSFLYGGNAQFIEQLQAAYERDPGSVDPDWQEFFANLGDNPADVAATAEGPSWARADWPQPLNGEMVSVLDGNWAVVEQAIGGKLAGKAAKSGSAQDVEELRTATLDSVRALMMIRAYRMRGHVIADLDPLNLREKQAHPELDPASYGFGPQDLDREIFIDHVLGLERATINQIVAILKSTYCSTMAVEFMHMSDPRHKAWLQERIEGPDKSIEFTVPGKKAILNKLIEAEGFEAYLNVK